jgi:hypothetical protein
LMRLSNSVVDTNTFMPPAHALELLPHLLCTARLGKCAVICASC